MWSRQQIKPLTGLVNVTGKHRRAGWIKRYSGIKRGRQMFANAGRADTRGWSAFDSLVCLSQEKRTLLCFFLWPSRAHTNIHRETHLPKHGCQSSHGWLQDIILSVRAYKHLNHTYCGVSFLTRLLWTNHEIFLAFYTMREFTEVETFPNPIKRKDKATNFSWNSNSSTTAREAKTGREYLMSLKRPSKMNKCF